MDSKSRAVGNGGVFAEENDLIDNLAGGFFPTEIQIVLLDNAFVVLKQSHVLISEAFYILQSRYRIKIETLSVNDVIKIYIINQNDD